MFDLIQNVESCYSNIPSVVYYSHIPIIIISLILGFFVFWNDKKVILNRLLFILTVAFSLWSFFDLILWLSHDSKIIMFFWSLIILVDVIVFIVSFYLVYVFINKKDISFYLKLILFMLLIPIIFLMSSRFNIAEFDATTCNGLEGFIAKQYLYSAEFILIISIISYALIKIINSNDKIEKRKNYFFVAGLILFLTIFSGSNFIASIYDTNNFLWSISQAGLFSAIIFMVFLAYLIVRYKAFNIKLLGAQALVVGLVILIGSQFFFIQNNTNRILTGVTLALAIGAGYVLVKSVKTEVERKEQLQMMSDKLAVANDQLRKLDNAKTEFISIASHQLRTPLTAVKGFISLLLEGSYGKLQKKHEEVLNKVYISNERLINLVEDLLNISRIESGRMEFTFQKWDIEKICSELVDTFLLKAKDRGLYLDYKKPEKTLPEVETDGAKLREVISNLIDNAIKYSPKGGVSIRLSQEGDNIQIAVSDTGIGIPQEELPYLFSKFSRGKDTSRLSVSGTGLGLYVGKSIMEAVGGKIRAESEGAGKGSRFIVEVPVEHSL